MIETPVDAAMSKLGSIREWETKGCPILPAVLVRTTEGILIVSAAEPAGAGKPWFWRCVGNFADEESKGEAVHWRVADQIAEGNPPGGYQYYVVRENPRTRFAEFGDGELPFVIDAQYVTNPDDLLLPQN